MRSLFTVSWGKSRLMWRIPQPSMNWRVEAINTLALPVVTYSFNVINWKLSEIKKLDTKTRKLLTLGKMHHPKADVDRLYLPRAKGGKGLTQVELTYKTTTIGRASYLTSTNDPLLHLVQWHENKNKLYSIPKEAAKFKKEFRSQRTAN